MSNVNQLAIECSRTTAYLTVVHIERAFYIYGSTQTISKTSLVSAYFTVIHGKCAITADINRSTIISVFTTIISDGSACHRKSTARCTIVSKIHSSSSATIGSGSNITSCSIVILNNTTIHSEGSVGFNIYSSTVSDISSIAGDRTTIHNELTVRTYMDARVPVRGGTPTRSSCIADSSSQLTAFGIASIRKRELTVIICVVTGNLKETVISPIGVRTITSDRMII